jgi:hypothetical protein
MGGFRFALTIGGSGMSQCRRRAEDAAGRSRTAFNQVVVGSIPTGLASHAQSQRGGVGGAVSVRRRPPDQSQVCDRLDATKVAGRTSRTTPTRSSRAWASARAYRRAPLPNPRWSRPGASDLVLSACRAGGHTLASFRESYAWHNLSDCSRKETGSGGCGRHSGALRKAAGHLEELPGGDSMRWVQVIATGAVWGLALAGCTANGGGGGGQMTWMRADGRPVDGGFKAAADQCRDVASRVGAGAPKREREETMMVAMQSCMQQRGYVWRCESPLGELAQDGCSEGEGAPGNRSRPARSAAPGRSTI